MVTMAEMYSEKKLQLHVVIKLNLEVLCLFYVFECYIFWNPSHY